MSPSARTKSYVQMRCPACGNLMNRHAVKVIEPRNANEASRVNAQLGGVVTEAHSCPACGKNAWRAG